MIAINNSAYSSYWNYNEYNKDKSLGYGDAHQIGVKYQKRNDADWKGKTQGNNF